MYNHNSPSQNKYTSTERRIWTLLSLDAINYTYFDILQGRQHKYTSLAKDFSKMCSQKHVHSSLQNIMDTLRFLSVITSVQLTTSVFGACALFDLHGCCKMCFEGICVFFGRQDATFSAAAECRGERGTERHLPVYCWRQMVTT